MLPLCADDQVDADRKRATEDTAVEKSMKENWSAGSGLLSQLAQSEEVPWGRER